MLLTYPNRRLQMRKTKRPDWDALVQIEDCHPRDSWEMCFHPRKRWSSQWAELFTRFSEQLPVAPPFLQIQPAHIDHLLGSRRRTQPLCLVFSPHASPCNCCPLCHSVAPIKQSEQILTPTFAFSHVIKKKEGNSWAEITFSFFFYMMKGKNRHLWSFLIIVL